MVKQQQLRSGVDGQAPLPADLAEGELALNFHENSVAIYLKDTLGAIRKIAGEGAVGTYWTENGTSIYYNSGNVGIGTTNPGALLDVNGTATFSGTVTITGSNVVDGTIRNNSEQTITASAFDLATGNYWTCGAITVPAPTNATAGTSGLIRITAGPVVWNAAFKFPGGTAPTISAFPAIIPFYVESASVILMGNVTDDIT